MNHGQTYAQYMAPPDVVEKPPWLRTRVASPARSQGMRSSLSASGLRTVCDSSRCPNLGDCWGQGHATFMLLGDVCTRDCRFCAVPCGDPGPVDEGEPSRVAEAVKCMGLRHVVITSVTRDDLEDGGAEMFAETVRQVRWMNPGTSIEVLVPDLQGRRSSLEAVAMSSPEVLGHNLETVRSLQWIRDARASYERSLGVLSLVKEMQPGIMTKSSLMLGLGEEKEEVVTSMKDLRTAGVELLTLGQYLPPAGSTLPLRRYVLPAEFDELRSTALSMDFRGVRAGPLVRSSYDAYNLIHEAGARRC
ncbi:MAG: lipoyl synthase [Methanomassiliicoccales archaeon]|nr:lipoyl synthase [Methanomassiliicoccales archaeon]